MASQITNYKCPACTGPLHFVGASGKLECDFCGGKYDVAEIEALYADKEAKAVEATEKANEKTEQNRKKLEEMEAQGWDTSSLSSDWGADANGMKAYNCPSCGAELICDASTAATSCPYCGNPSVVPGQFSGALKPDYVIPFKLDKKAAEAALRNHMKGKRLLPHIFLHTSNRIAEMRKLYVPYWLFDCDAHGSVVYDAEKQQTERKGEWEITRIKHYIAHREGSMCFENIPVDGSEKLDNRITESLEPYDLSAAVPFKPAVLAGALADHADVDAKACEGRAVERVETSISDALRGTVNGYSRVTERSKSISAQGGKVTPVLMPVWLITTEKEGKTYTFAINGQTGKLTCDVPADRKKSLAWGGGVFAGVLGLSALALGLADQLARGTLLLAAILAAIVALIVVGCLRGQLKQAAQQSAAGGYVREGSFHLDVNADHFLYESTTKRKIENNTQKK